MYDQPMHELPEDAALAEQMKGQLNEANERSDFHRRELERCERIARAASRALEELLPNAKAPQCEQAAAAAAAAARY